MQRYTLIPCRKSKAGKIIPHANEAAPHGFHHVVKAYADGSYTLVGTVHHSFNASHAFQVMHLLAGPIPHVKDPDFYKKAAAAGVKGHSNHHHKKCAE